MKPAYKPIVFPPPTGLPVDAFVDYDNRITIEEWWEVQNLLYAAERRGFCVDVDLCAEKLAQANADMVPYLEAWNAEYPGINPNSPDQMARLFYRECREEHIRKLEHEIELLEADVTLFEEAHKAAIAAGKTGKKEANGIVVRKKRVDKAQEALAAFIASPFLDMPVSPVTKTGAAQEGKFPTDAGAIEWFQATQGVNLQSLEMVRKTKKTIERLTQILEYAMSTDGEMTYRLHANLKRGTTSGRLSCAAPNLQNIPKDKRKDKYNVRAVFVASPGYRLVVADYSQLEMRVAAHILEVLFNDTKLKTDLLAADAHSANALRVFGPLRPYLKGLTPSDVKNHPDPRVRQCRDDIKAVTYGFFYGKSAIGLGASLRDDDGNPIGEFEAQKVIDGFLDLYPALAAYVSFVWESVKAGAMYTIGGRAAKITRVNRAEHRRALNRPMQGGGEDIMDRALLSIAKELQKASIEAHFVLAVHDELVFEVREDQAEAAAAIIEREMKAAWELLCPLDISVGIADNWAEAK